MIHMIFAIVLFIVSVCIVWMAGKDKTRTEPMQNDPASEDLEEAAKHYLYKNILYDDVYVGNPTDKDCEEMFKAGAEWQKKQMVNRAIYCEAHPQDGEIWGSFEHLNLNDGDKIRVIIIKDE